jgi:hypothetical protein
LTRTHRPRLICGQSGFSLLRHSYWPCRKLLLSIMDPSIYMGIATIVAVLVGPIAAVWVTRHIDESRLKQTRRMDVFRTLMRTRRMRLNPDHVGALNLVEIEFYGENPVIESWKGYWTHFRQSLPVDPNQQQQFLRDQEGLLTKLLHAIAKTLQFNIEQLEIFEGGYVPQGWIDDDQSVRIMRALILEILNGRRGLPIVPLTVAPQSPYLRPNGGAAEAATKEVH